MASSEKTCSNCRGPNAALKCGVCKKTWYCSGSCQREDWQFHKRTCAKPTAAVASSSQSADLPSPVVTPVSPADTPVAPAADAAPAVSPGVSAEPPATAAKAETSAPAEADDLYDEEDRAAMAAVRKMGYRYFSKPNSTNIVDIKPRKVDAPVPTASAVVDPSAASAPSTKGSAWNAAGTFEERTFGPWLRGRIKELLLVARRAGRLSVELKPDQWLCARGISGWGGSSADIVIARGKARYVYDLHFAVDFEVLSEAQAKALVESHAVLDDEDSAAGRSSAAAVAEPKADPAPAAPLAAAAAAAAATIPDAAVGEQPPAAPASDEKAKEKEKPPPRVLLTIEAGVDNEGAPGLAIVSGKPKPSEGTLERARKHLDLKLADTGGVVGAVREALEAALSEYKAK